MKRWLSALVAALLLGAVLVGCGWIEPEKQAEQPPVSFQVHFIDVGQADAALVLCGDAAMLIDGGNRDDSSLIYTYLKEQGIAHLDYVVATHAHEDHVGGLSGALNYATVGTALCSVEDYNSKVFDTFVDQLAKQGKQITVPRAGETFALGDAQVQVLGPVRESDNPNNMSLVLRVVYGETSFLFAGDAEREEEQDILDAGYELDSTVLKVGHHGSENSTTYPFLREIMPDYGVISVGEGNTYGHPTNAALSRLRDAGVQVLRTDHSGTILCSSDGQTVLFREEKGQTEWEEPVQDGGADYVLNLNTRRFHYPDCDSVKSIVNDNKGTYTGTRQQLVEQGYVPCGGCKP